MIISVTKKDIAEGKKSNPYFCPIALAFYRRTGRQFVVYYRSYYERNVGKARKLPITAVEFIRRFDSFYQEVKPFRFTVPDDITNDEN